MEEGGDAEATFAVVPVDSGEAQACLAAYYAELDVLFTEGFDPALTSQADADELTPPRGVFVVIRHEGEARGCGALVTVEPGVGEIKRMWVHPVLRGHGMGRRLLVELEDHARALGMRTVLLDTNEALTPAIALYGSAGYRATARYNDNPYAHHWFLKQL